MLPQARQHSFTPLRTATGTRHSRRHVDPHSAAPPAPSNLVSLVERVFEDVVTVQLVNPAGSRVDAAAGWEQRRAAGAGVAGTRLRLAGGHALATSPRLACACWFRHAHGARFGQRCQPAFRLLHCPRLPCRQPVPPTSSRGAQQLGDLRRVRLRQQHEGGAGHGVEAVQVKRVGLHQLQGGWRCGAGGGGMRGRRSGGPRWQCSWRGRAVLPPRCTTA